MDRLITLGLSDLHLGQAQCPISENLFSLLDSIKTLDTLIVSGDLFEVWLGDDASTDFQWHIAERFKAIGAKTSVFLPGNRDFLLGEAWLQAAGMTPHLSFAFSILILGLDSLLVSTKASEHTSIVIYCTVLRDLLRLRW